jgi:prepilin-type N-terminal cleavage/methylation domain-containing protein
MKGKFNHGFTVIELLVVVSVICILAAMLFPVIGRARLSAYGSRCTGNLKQLHTALRLYLDDYGEQFPVIYFDWSGTTQKEEHFQTYDNPYRFDHVMRQYVKSRQVFRCPADTGVVTPRDLKSGNISRLHVPSWERWGSSYRPAAELGKYEFCLADLKDEEAQIPWAGDYMGYWHTKYSRLPNPYQADDEDTDNDLDRWQNNVVFIDGHIKTVGFNDQIWNPYLRLLNTKIRLR